MAFHLAAGDYWSVGRRYRPDVIANNNVFCRFGPERAG